MSVMEIMCDEHLAKVRSFAAENGISAELEKKLEYLRDYGVADDGDDALRVKCVLYSGGIGLGGNSFEFLMMKRKTANEEYRLWFNGGLVYHDKYWGVHT